MLASLRQWFYTKEFRIKGSGVSLEKFNVEELIKRFEKLLKIMSKTMSRVDEKFVKEIATSVWRLEKRMEHSSGSSKLARIQRALDLMKDVLEGYEVEIKDFTGKPVLKF